MINCRKRNEMRDKFDASFKIPSKKRSNPNVSSFLSRPIINQTHHTHADPSGQSFSTPSREPFPNLNRIESNLATKKMV